MKHAHFLVLITGLIVHGVSHAACNVDVQALQFGPLYDMATTPANGEGVVAVDCDAIRTVRISLNFGQGAATAPQRALTSAGDSIQYQIFSDASHTQIWGDGRPGAADVMTQSGMPVTLHGRIPAGQRPRPGNYSDLIEITVEW